MFRRMLSFLLLLLGFFALFYAAMVVSQFVINHDEIKGVLTIFRVVVEGAFIGAPLFFLRKLKGEEGINKKEKKKAYQLTAALLVLVVAVEVFIALS